MSHQCLLTVVPYFMDSTSQLTAVHDSSPVSPLFEPQCRVIFISSIQQKFEIEHIEKISYVKCKFSKNPLLIESNLKLVFIHTECSMYLLPKPQSFDWLAALHLDL